MKDVASSHTSTTRVSLPECLVDRHGSQPLSEQQAPPLSIPQEPRASAVSK